MSLRARKSSQQDVVTVPQEFLDATCYFITPSAFDTLLQCTTNHQATFASQSKEASMLSQPRRPTLWTSPSHFFTGSLVCTDPPLVLATGSAVDVLERDWQNYFVMLDLNNVAPYGRLPSVFSTIACVHGISKSYPIHTFGETSWIVIELDPLRSHIPTRAPRAHGKIRTRTRSNSLPPSPSTPPDDSSNFPLSSSPNSSAQPPDMHPSHSVCFDINQASSTPVMPSSSIPHPWRASDGHSCTRTTSMHLRNQDTFPIRHSTLFNYNSNSTEEAPWKLEEGLLVAINDGKPCPSDSWVIGAGGKLYLQSDREYVFTLANGLAGD
ncbi:12403_t:CDS:2, partial [Acaulospora colombiana]